MFSAHVVNESIYPLVARLSCFYCLREGGTLNKGTVKQVKKTSNLFCKIAAKQFE